MSQKQTQAFAVLDGIKRYVPGTMKVLTSDAGETTRSNPAPALGQPDAAQVLLHQTTPQLRRWVSDSMAAGTGRAQLFRSMLEQGYPMETCSRELDGFMPKLKLDAVRDASLRQRGETPLSLFFAFANIDLLHRPGIERIPEARLQLYQWPRFFTDDECDQLVAQLSPFFSRSTVIDQQLTGLDTYRTSSTAHLSERNPSLNRRLVERISTGMGVDPGYAEGIQVQRYYPGQQYKVHTDFFHVSSPSYRETLGDTGQRTWTCVIYLNDDFQGGETLFERVGKSLTPARGKAVFWNNLSPLGVPNEFTYHCGLPVIEGVKYIVTTWFREKPRRERQAVPQVVMEEFERRRQEADGGYLDLLRDIGQGVEHVTLLGESDEGVILAFLAMGAVVRCYDSSSAGTTLEAIAGTMDACFIAGADLNDIEPQPTDLLFINLSRHDSTALALHTIASRYLALRLADSTGILDFVIKYADTWRLSFRQEDLVLLERIGD